MPKTRGPHLCFENFSHVSFLYFIYLFSAKVIFFLGGVGVVSFREMEDYNAAEKYCLNLNDSSAFQKYSPWLFLFVLSTPHIFIPSQSVGYLPEPWKWDPFPHWSSCAATVLEGGRNVGSTNHFGGPFSSLKFYFLDDFF